MGRASDLELRRATPEDEPAILALARATLGWEDDRLSAGLFRWKHDENPFGASPRWVAVDGDELAGFRVFLRWRFTASTGATFRAVRAVDTATHPDHQGQGIFTRLTRLGLAELEAEGVDFVFNTPNDKSRPGYLKMGWVEVGKPAVGVRPRLRSLAKVAKARVPADLWSQPSDAGDAAPEAFADDAWVADLLAHCPQPAGWTTERSPAFLRWRYGHGPLRYRVVTDGRGAAVFRVRRRGPAVEATVADVLAPDPAERRRLLRQVLAASGADYLLVATDALLDRTPVVRMPGLGPLVTWRELVRTQPPRLGDLALTMGDLELF